MVGSYADALVAESMRGQGVAATDTEPLARPIPPLQQRRLWRLPLLRAMLLGTQDPSSPLSQLCTGDTELLELLLGLLVPHWCAEVPVQAAPLCCIRVFFTHLLNR